MDLNHRDLAVGLGLANRHSYRALSTFQDGADGAIRTLTVLGLSQLPPTVGLHRRKAGASRQTRTVNLCVLSAAPLPNWATDA